MANRLRGARCSLKVKPMQLLPPLVESGCHAAPSDLVEHTQPLEESLRDAAVKRVRHQRPERLRREV